MIKSCGQFHYQKQFKCHNKVSALRLATLPGMGNLQVPHVGLRSFPQKSTCPAQSTYMVQIWSRYPRISVQVSAMRGLVARLAAALRLAILPGMSSLQVIGPPRDRRAHLWRDRPTSGEIDTQCCGSSNLPVFF